LAGAEARAVAIDVIVAENVCASALLVAIQTEPTAVAATAVTIALNVIIALTVRAGACVGAAWAPETSFADGTFARGITETVGAWASSVAVSAKPTRVANRAGTVTSRSVAAETVLASA